MSELPGEGALAEKARSQSDAFAALYDYYFPRVYNYVRYRLRRRDLADDITARVFERALTRIGSFDPGRSPFGAWLFAIARNAVRDRLRAERRRRWVSLEWLTHRASGDVPADEIMVGRERHDKLLAALGRLGAREQEIMALKFGAGRSNREIARTLRLTEGNVAVILHRAVRKLRIDLEREEGL